MTRARAQIGRARLWGGIAALAILAGCSSDGEDTLKLDLLKASVAGLVSDDAPDATPSRALIDEAEVPLILARLPERDMQATIYPIEQNGPVTTWTATDKSTIALRGGQLVASRGLSPDLMSAAVPTMAELRSGAPVGRSHFYLGRDDQTARQDFTCVGRDEGAATLEIAGVTFATQVLAETCEGPSARFTNRYWLQADGTVRQSAQWVGPDVGFLELQRLDR